MTRTEIELYAIRKLLVTQALMQGELLLALNRSPMAPQTAKDCLEAIRVIDGDADKAAGVGRFAKPEL